jgi:DNA-binding transcriptional MocR family regulator
VIEFHLDTRSGVSPYLQLIHQVRQALRLGLLSEGDQLPTVKDVVARLAINPNTVLKAYRELEYEGLAAAPSPTSPPAATGPSSGSRPGSSWPSPWPWRGSAAGGPAAGGPDMPGEG